VAALTRFFLQKSARELSVDAKRISEPALQRLMQFDFPGNVRQLENICHWLTVMAPAQVVESKDLPPELLTSAPPTVARVNADEVAPAAAGLAALPSGDTAAGQEAPASTSRDTASAPWLIDLERESRKLLEAGTPEVWDMLTRQFEGQLIHTALDITRGRRIEAAQKLGIGRNTITRKIQELGLDA
jgi:two-component system nitrogen regulation response regulator GlnG